MLPRRVDVVIAVALAALTLAVSLYWAPRGFHYGFADMGNDGYQLREVLDLHAGGVIFRDTFDQYGPSTGYLNTIGFVLLGRRLLAIKFWLCVWYAGIAVMLFGTARRWLSPLLAAFSVVIWIGLAPFYQHGVMISPHVYVLALQALTLWLVLRSDVDTSRARWVIAGALIGLSWGFKQSIGVLFFAGVLTFLPALALTRRAEWSSVRRAAISLAAGSGAVVAATLLALWIAGALPDWYRQTVAFPRDFYLAGGAGSQFRASLGNFVQLQRTAAPYWWLLRAVVIAAGVVALARRSESKDAILLALVTAALSLAAYPSANFMHQWWTVSLSIGFFVAVLSRVAALLSRRPWIVDGLTILIVVTIFHAGLDERLRAMQGSMSAVSVAMEAPASMRGIRVAPAAYRMFSVIDDEVQQFAREHPGSRVISIDEELVASSLPILSFLPQNPHSSPIYWNEPVLSTTTYPGYLPALQQEIARTRPLLVDHHAPPFRVRHIPGYALKLVAVIANRDAGFWYVYEPIERTPPAAPMFLDGDGRLRPLPIDEREQAAVVDPPPVVREVRAAHPARLDGADLYTFPDNLPLERFGDARAVVKLDAVPTTRAAAVTSVDSGAWTVDGHVDSRYGYLLQYPPAELKQGAVFIARGTVREGGLSVGLIQPDGRWNGVVNVTKPGPFEVVLEVPSTGSYSVTVANCIESKWQGTFGRLTEGNLQNHFSVTAAGWLPR